MPAIIDNSDSIKQVIVLRRDLHMRQGKAVAQGAHAAMMFLIAAGIEQRDLRAEEECWIAEGTTKICLRVDSEEELLSVIARCREHDVQCFPVIDTGHTEFHGIPTLTCCAIGPHYSRVIDEITGWLKLM